MLGFRIVSDRGPRRGVRGFIPEIRAFAASINPLANRSNFQKIRRAFAQKRERGLQARLLSM
jgi:hypothetical protein